MGIDVRGAAVDAVRTVKGINVPTNGDDISLIVYEIDSLDLIEIGMLIEAQLGFEIDSDEFDGVTTFGDVLRVLERQAARAGT